MNFPRYLIVAALATALLGGARFVPDSAAHAAQTLTVTTTDDGSCTDVNGMTLRCAITQANSDGSGDTIGFNIPATGSNGYKNACSTATIHGVSVLECKISIHSSLPTLTASSTVINGYTQPGAVDNTKAAKSGNNAILTIRVDGGGVNSQGYGIGNGLVVSGASDTIEGLSITNFTNGDLVYTGASGVVLEGSQDSVTGSFIGVTPTDGGVPNDIGITIQSPGTSDTIGGTAAALDNVISANAQCTITSASYQVDINGSTNNRVEGNVIGPNAAGGAFNTGAPCGYGVELNNATGNTIGGSTSATANNISKNLNDGIDSFTSTGNAIQGNLINGNNLGILLSGTSTGDQVTGNTITNTTYGPGGEGNGIWLYNNESGATIAKNRIGTNASGANQGNYGYGIDLTSASSNTISQNTVAFNGKQGTNVAGIMVGGSASDTATKGNVISRNAIYDNAGLGIDLAPQSVVNCTTSPPGPNGYVHCPVIKSATTTTINGTACPGCTVEVFIATNESDDQGHGEGKTFLGSVIASSTTGSWSLTLASGKVAVGQMVTATATTPASPGPAETSEFGANVTVS